MVKISVVIPVYNAEKTIVNCVNSVLSQTFSDYEIFLIDDGSSDNSLAICNSLKNSDERISVFSFENHGAAYCRNFGIKNANGEYIAFIDSDDKIDAGAFSYMYEVAEKRSADIVMCGYIMENGNSRKNITANEGFYVGEEINSRMIEIKSKNLIDSPCNKLYRREFLLKNGIYMPENEIFEDTDFNLRILKFSPRFVICKTAFYHYILRMGSTTRKFNPEKLTIIKKRAALLKEVTSGIDDYCDFYYIKSVFSAFIDAFLSLKRRKVFGIINSEINKQEFREKTIKASHSGIGSIIIIYVAKSHNSIIVYLFCKAAYIVKYKFQKLFMKVK